MIKDLLSLCFIIIMFFIIIIIITRHYIQPNPL